jgi:hypothetical protein
MKMENLPVLSLIIDATGDGDLCYRAGLESYTNDLLQPPTVVSYLDGFDEKEFFDLIKQHGKEYNIPEGFVWGAKTPCLNSFMLVGTRVYDVNCSVADELTKAEMEGRRQVRANMDIVRKYGKSKNVGLVSLPSCIGIRETRHIKCLYQVTDDDASYGKRFDDAIANGSFKLDNYHQDLIISRYLDGTEDYVLPDRREKRRWREETAVNPTFYQIPLRSIIPEKSDNIILAGRMLDACPIAFGGVRVMVNLNQVGEAAGVTSYLALNQNKTVRKVSSADVRKELAKGGSIII